MVKRNCTKPNNITLARWVNKTLNQHLQENISC
jgi:hypothetical protein